jgi:hypothetical protein
MGKFSSGPWIIGLAVYFTVFFLITYCIFMIAASYPDIDTAGVNIHNVIPVVPTDATGYCAYSAASKQPIICGDNTQTSCYLHNITGQCYYNETSSKCEPYYQIISFMNCDSALVKYNQTLCQGIESGGLGGGKPCQWTDTSSYVSSSVENTGSYDWSAVLLTVITMAGFGGSIGVPSAYSFIVSFFIFWIPFFAFLWAVYMALPWVH